MQYLFSLVNIARLNLTDRLDAAALEQLSRKHDLGPLAPESSGVFNQQLPRLHVELASRLSPAMEAAPDAPPGTISVVAASELEAAVRPANLVLCRLNAPLHDACMRVARLDLPAILRGEDLLGRLLKLGSQALGARSQDQARRLRRHLPQAHRQLAAGGPAAARKRFAAETVFLQQLCTELGAQGQLRLEARHDRLAFLFTPRNESVIFSSIHRDKGMEADHVVLLYPELLPAPYARSAEALQAERCLKFVALTRAKRHLVIVEAPGPGEPPDSKELRSGASAEESIHDEFIRTWQSVLQAARSGRRHREAPLHNRGTSRPQGR